MDFALIESMTPNEANAILHGFLESEKPAIEAMRVHSCNTDTCLNYRLDTLTESLKWFLRQVKVKNVPVPSTEPSWIQHAHKNGLYEFDEVSKTNVLHAAFYLGESFVQANEKLKWAIGNPEMIQKNMPVVTGFQRGHELAPLMVVENVFLRILGDRVPLTHLDKMVEVWHSRLP
jgi:hypothetical protein